MIENAKIDPPTKAAGTTLNTGSVPSCLRNDNGTCRKKPLDRRVSFPDDDQQIVTSFLEPANPWEYADSVDKEELESIYILSCKKHAARPLSPVLNQIQNLDFDLERNECLSLKGERLGAAECETLEEILKRVQFSTVNLEATCLDDEASVAMFDMMEYYESAMRLNIAGNHSIGVRGWQACSHMIKRTKCLEELDARNTTLNEQYMPILSRALRLSTQLHVLKLENCNLSGRPIIILAAALKLNTALKELYLGENYLSVNDAIQLSAVLKVNSTLQLLDISNNNIQDVGMGHLSEGLSEQNNSGSGLAVLVVWNNHLTRNSSSHLARVLTHSKTLEMLNVGQNVLSNEVLHTTKDALQKNKTLLRLGMQSTHLTCEGAVALAEIIADNSVIQRIDLRDNNLQVAGLMALALSMKVNMNVTQLDLDDSPRRKHSMGATLDEYVRLVAEIRGFCQRNESIVAKTEQKLSDTVVTETEPITTPEKRARLGSFASRKISLTCETLMRTTTVPTPEPVVQHLTEPKRSGGRLRSPAPSPIPSPVASPSPTRSRFQVSRVSESESPVTPPSSANNFFNSGSGSRFKVTVVDYPPTNSTPVPVVAGNNVTVGFETPVTLTLSPTPAQIASSLSTSESLPFQSSLTVTDTSPSSSPSPSTSSSSACTVVTSYHTIPMLFPTPMPSPMTSPVPSPSYAQPEHSPFKENTLNDTLTSSEVLAKNVSPPLEPSSAPLDNKPVQHISSPNNVPSAEAMVDNNTATNIQTDLVDSKIYNPRLDLDNEVQSEVPSSPSVSLTSHDSVLFSREKKFRSDSEESDKDMILTKSRLPKTMDSLDYSALHVLKQPSISVAEKPTQRSRKISWVQPSSMFSAVTSQDDPSKPTSSLERLLSLFNPFSRQKTEEEPQLQSVPELSEKTSQQSDNNVVSVSEPKHFSVTHTVDKIVQSISEISVSSCLSNVNNPLENCAEKQTNCEQDCSNFNVLKTVVDESNLKSDLKVNNSTITCAPTFLESSSRETESELKSENIPDNLNNNKTYPVVADVSEIKCETWPQGRTSLAKLSVIHQSQSKSAPCLAALVLLQSNVASDLSVDIKKLSPSQSDDTMDAAKNITWAL